MKREVNNMSTDDKEFREKFRGEKFSKWKPMQFKMFILFIMIGAAVTIIGKCLAI
jgi:hypothetical protein